MIPFSVLICYTPRICYNHSIAFHHNYNEQDNIHCSIIVLKGSQEVTAIPPWTDLLRRPYSDDDCERPPQDQYLSGMCFVIFSILEMSVSLPFTLWYCGYCVLCYWYWQIGWLGGVLARALDSRSIGRGFNSRPVHRRVATLGKLFTPMCLCHQAV